MLFVNPRMNRKGGVLMVLFLILLIGILIAASYFLYLNLPGAVQELRPTNGIGDEDIGQGVYDTGNYSQSTQFYENMRFADREITYNIDSKCDDLKIEKINDAFNTLDEKTVLSFSSSNNGQIQVYCSDDAPEPKEKGHFVAGEGGPTEVINTSLYGVILAGQMSLFKDDKCDDAHIALHELLHVLGFDHNDNPNSILYPTLDCKQEIDSYIIEEISRLYQKPGFADLKIVEVDASKSGRYLNFEIKVVNQGLVDVSGAKLRVYGDGKVIMFQDPVSKEKFDYLDLEELEVGTTKRLEVSNAKMASRGVDEIIFLVDEDDDVEELFEDNNRIEFTV